MNKKFLIISIGACALALIVAGILAVYPKRPSVQQQFLKNKIEMLQFLNNKKDVLMLLESDIFPSSNVDATKGKALKFKPSENQTLKMAFDELKCERIYLDNIDGKKVLKVALNNVKIDNKNVYSQEIVFSKQGNVENGEMIINGWYYVTRFYT